MKTSDIISHADMMAAAAKQLRAAAIESPRREARLLLAYVMNVSQEDIMAGRLPLATHKDALAYKVVVDRRRRREPLAYIVGRREFWSLDFAVGPGVLIPRPESELLVEQALKHFPDSNAPLRVLDLGTGSGCLLLSFLSERPNAQGLGVDLSEAALTIAEKNAASLGLSGRASFQRSDWLENVSGTFDVILINPPYIAETAIGGLQPEVATYEPASALYAGSDGLDAYRVIASSLRERMAAGGHAFLEVGQGQAPAVDALLSGQGLLVEGTVCDLAGIPRCVIAARA